MQRRKIKELIADESILKVQDGNHGEKHPTASDYVEEGILCPPQSVDINAERNLIPLHNEIGILTRQTQNLRRTRDLLLPRLLSGQVNLIEN